MGFFAEAGEKLKGIGQGIADGVKQVGTDIADIGRQVRDGVVAAGKAAVEGGKTLISDPKKFANDVKTAAMNWGEHIKADFEGGKETIRQGIDDTKNGMNLFHAIGKTLDGIAQMASLGALDAWEQHLEKSKTAVTDEMGNVISYTANEGTDAFTRIFIRNAGHSMAIRENADSEIREALAEGDAKRAQKIDDDRFWSTTGKAVADVAVPVVAAVSIPLTGGFSAIPIGCAMAGNMGVSMAAGASEANFNKLNVTDDIADRAGYEAEVLVKNGILTEEQAETYEAAAECVYAASAYDADPEAGVHYGFSDNEDMLNYVLTGKGLEAAVGNIPDAPAEYAGTETAVPENTEEVREDVTEKEGQEEFSV